MIGDNEYFFSCVCWPSESLLENCLCKLFAHFWVGAVESSTIELWWFLVHVLFGRVAYFPHCYWWYFIFIADNRTIWNRLNLFCTIRNCVMLLPCIGELFGVWTCFLCVGPVGDRERVSLSTSAPDTVSEVSTGAYWVPASRQLGTRLAVSSFWWWSLIGWWESEAKLYQMPSGGA